MRTAAIAENADRDHDPEGRGGLASRRLGDPDVEWLGGTLASVHASGRCRIRATASPPPRTARGRDRDRRLRNVGPASA